MTEQLIKAGDIWECTKTGQTIEWLKDMKPLDPIIVASMMVNGKVSNVGDKIPSCFISKHNILHIIPPENVRVIRKQSEANT